MRRRLRIAFIGIKGIPASHGGVEKYVEQLSVRLVNRGHEITVFSRSTYTHTDGCYMGINTVRLPASQNKYYSMFCHTLLCILFILFSRMKFDIVHIHGADMSIFALLARLRARVVVTSHGRVYGNVSTVPAPLRFVSRLAEQCFLRWPHCRIAVAKHLVRYYCSISRMPVFYIPVGVDVDNDNRRASDGLSEFGLVDKEYILFVGRLIPTKRVDLLIAAYQQVNTVKKLVIVGDAPYNNSTHVERLKKNASENIRFLGFQYGAKLADLFRGSLFFVLPSENEGLPVALLEALRYGCAIIASDIPANVEALAGHGITFKNGSESDLSDKLLYMLKNSDLAEKIGKATRQYVVDNYSWNQIITRHEDIYYSLVR